MATDRQATRELLAKLRIAHDAGAGYHITVKEMELLLSAAAHGVGMQSRDEQCETEK